MSIFDRFSEKERQILKARAERVANELTTRQAGDDLTALLVHIQGERYALPIASITVVHENIAIEPVPCVPDYVSGLANVRGHILPVIDLSVLLGVPGRPAMGEVSLIVVENDRMSMALYVEQIGEVAALPLKKLAPVPMTLGIERMHYLQGVLPDGTVLLDVGAILRDERIIVDEQAGG